MARDVLDDLVTFARVEVESHDLEPWAELCHACHHRGVVDDVERALWLVKLYNATDSFGAAWRAFRRWPTPYWWVTAEDRADLGDGAVFMPTQERRNLRGGRILQSLRSYVDELDGWSQLDWLRLGIRGHDPEVDHGLLVAHMRRVWGVGRQAGFEWAEFVDKLAVGIDARAPDAMLWESEGPRRSLQRIFGNDRPTLAWLDARAVEVRTLLAENGIDLRWEDLETVICDFNVMRDGRYYPGRHLAALREEIDELDVDDRRLILDVWHDLIPAPWRDIGPGIDKAMMPRYRDTGRLHLPFAGAIT